MKTVTKRVLVKDVIHPKPDRRSKHDMFQQPVIPTGTCFYLVEEERRISEDTPWTCLRWIVYKSDDNHWAHQLYPNQTLYPLLLDASKEAEVTVDDWVKYVYPRGLDRYSLTKIMGVLLSTPEAYPLLLGIDDDLDEVIKLRLAGDNTFPMHHI